MNVVQQSLDTYVMCRFWLFAGKPELRGYNLSPLSSDEIKAINSLLKRWHQICDLLNISEDKHKQSLLTGWRRVPCEALICGWSDGKNYSLDDHTYAVYIFMTCFEDFSLKLLLNVVFYIKSVKYQNFGRLALCHSIKLQYFTSWDWDSLKTICCFFPKVAQCYFKSTRSKFKVTTRNSQFLLIAPLWTKAVVTQAPTVLNICASVCQAGRTRHNSGNACVCFGSEWKRDGRMDGDEVIYLYVTEK